MYRFAICDDDSEFCSAFAACLKEILDERTTDFTTDIFYDTSAFMQSLESGREYDLLFLDILMEDKNGIDLARSLRLMDCRFDIIFITTCGEYAIDSFDVDPLYYLLKPVQTAKLKAALERFLKKNTPGSIPFRTSKGYLNIRIPDIVYIETYNHNIVIYKADGSIETFRGILKDVESQLPSAAFLKPHRSYLVNFEHISKFSRGGITVTLGTVIPVSKRLFNKAQLEFTGYLSKGGIYI